MNTTDNLEALRDVAQVWENFEGRNFKMSINDDNEIVVECYCHPFYITSNFIGDGIAHIAASFNSRRYGGNGLYDSHWEGENKVLFFEAAKTLYDSAACSLVNEISKNPNDYNDSIKYWAIRFQAKEISKDSKQITERMAKNDDANPNQVIRYMVQNLITKANILNSLTGCFK